jgi:phosphotransferase system  glucose/maltose/N-acetylglucosamine-specific IIC component
MIERLLSVGTGALVTYLALVILNPTDSLDPNGDYLTAVLIGAAVSLIWPLVWLFMIRRRRQNKMDEKVAEEVAKQTGG